MSDRFEGHLPRITVEAYGEEVDATPGNAMPGLAMPGATPEWGRAHLGDQADRRRREVYVNCWHVNEVESEAMWVLYGLRGASVAITSTFARLRNSLAPTMNLIAGAVRYQRFDSEHVTPDDFLAPIFHKRKSFEHERELRVVWLDPSPDPAKDFRLVPVDLPTLLTGVRLAPGTSSAISEAVRGLLGRYSLAELPLGSSILDKVPDYS
jgi:hypothetical protein